MAQFISFFKKQDSSASDIMPTSTTVTPLLQQTAQLHRVKSRKKQKKYTKKQQIVCLVARNGFFQKSFLPPSPLGASPKIALIFGF